MNQRKVVNEVREEKNNSLVFGGVLLVMASVAMLTYIVNAKILDLS